MRLSTFRYEGSRVRVRVITLRETLRVTAALPTSWLKLDNFSTLRYLGRGDTLARLKKHPKMPPFSSCVVPRESS